MALIYVFHCSGLGVRPEFRLADVRHQIIFAGIVLATLFVPYPSSPRTDRGAGDGTWEGSALRLLGASGWHSVLTTLPDMVISNLRRGMPLPRGRGRVQAARCMMVSISRELMLTPLPRRIRSTTANTMPAIRPATLAKANLACYCWWRWANSLPLKR